MTLTRHQVLHKKTGLGRKIFPGLGEPDLLTSCCLVRVTCKLLCRLIYSQFVVMCDF